jgi:hypothetical protein
MSWFKEIEQEETKGTEEEGKVAREGRGWSRIGGEGSQK